MGFLFTLFHVVNKYFLYIAILTQILQVMGGKTKYNTWVTQVYVVNIQIKTNDQNYF